MTVDQILAQQDQLSISQVEAWMNEQDRKVHAIRADMKQIHDQVWQPKWAQKLAQDAAPAYMSQVVKLGK